MCCAASMGASRPPFFERPIRAALAIPASGLRVKGRLSLGKHRDPHARQHASSRQWRRHLRGGQHAHDRHAQRDRRERHRGRSAGGVQRTGDRRRLDDLRQRHRPPGRRHLAARRQPQRDRRQQHRLAISGGAIYSGGDNILDDNTTDGSFTRPDPARARLDLRAQAGRLPRARPRRRPARGAQPPRLEHDPRTCRSSRSRRRSGRFASTTGSKASWRSGCGRRTGRGRAVG